MIYGRATKIEDPAAKAIKLRGMVDALLPGRWEGLRAITDKEIKATSVLTMPIEEASAKIRTGGPIDDEEDYDLPIWAGVIPIEYVTRDIQDDPRNLPGVKRPPHVENYKIG